MYISANKVNNTFVHQRGDSSHQFPAQLGAVWVGQRGTELDSGGSIGSLWLIPSFVCDIMGCVIKKS